MMAAKGAIKPMYQLMDEAGVEFNPEGFIGCLLYTSPSPRDRTTSRMPSSA